MLAWSVEKGRVFVFSTRGFVRNGVIIVGEGEGVGVTTTGVVEFDSIGAVIWRNGFITSERVITPRRRSSSTTHNLQQW